jgi:arsenite-transporting ATPase
MAFEKGELLNIFKREIVLFGGKGGTGKTVCAAATGLYAAEHGKKTLVFSTDPAHSLSDIFEQSIGDKITPIEGKKNLWCFEIDAKRAVDEERKWWIPHIEEILKDMPYRGVERELLQKVWDIPLPGLDELLALSELSEIMETHQFDTIVIDTAAGAHTIWMTTIPDIAIKWFEKIIDIMETARMRETPRHAPHRVIFRHLKPYFTVLGRIEGYLKKARNLKSLLADSSRTTFVLVTIAERMGLYVTEDIARDLQNSQIDCHNIIINCLIPEAKCEFCSSKRVQQRKCVEEYYEKFRGYNIVEAPLLPQEVKGLKALESFARVLFEGAKPPEAKAEPIIRETYSFGGLNLDGFEFVLFGGKGGCGKTTCAASSGIHLAKKGKSVLVISTDPQKSLSDSFGQELLHDEITPIKGMPGLYALEIDTLKGIKDFKKRYEEGIDELVEATEILTKKEAHDLLELPVTGGMGLDEAIALMRIVEIMDKKKYNAFILDTAPTGHTMRFLELPSLIEEWIKFTLSTWDKVKYMIHRFKRGYKYKAEVYLEDLLDKAKKIKSTLLAPTTKFVPVTTLEEMAMMESEDLLKILHSYEIPVDSIIVNRLTLPVGDCPYCTSIFNSQQKTLQEIRKKFPDLRIVAIPLFPHEIRGIEDLSNFGKILFEGVKQA